MYNLPQPWKFKLRMHNETALRIMPLKEHTIEQFEYNLLNRQAVQVRQIEPRKDRRPEEDQFRRDDYPRDRYDQDYSPKYDQGERRYQDRQGYNNQRRNQNYRRGNYNRRNECRERR